MIGSVKPLMNAIPTKKITIAAGDRRSISSTMMTIKSNSGGLPRNAAASTEAAKCSLSY